MTQILFHQNTPQGHKYMYKTDKLKLNEFNPLHDVVIPPEVVASHSVFKGGTL